MPRKLHIGGEIRSPEWEVLNALPYDHVDHVCDARDLSIFQNNTFTELYASHILEHFEYLNDELFNVLKEWYRVLIPSGKLYISVPDLDVLAQLFIQKDQLTFEERFYIMRIILGGHTNQYDFHRTGLSQDILEFYLTHAGYINLRKVDSFGFFNDASDIMFKDKLISLNMIAEKPKLGSENPISFNNVS